MLLPSKSKSIDPIKIEYPVTTEMMKFDSMINSNNFNAYDLHKETKKNSLYFML